MDPSAEVNVFLGVKRFMEFTISVKSSNCEWAKSGSLPQPIKRVLLGVDVCFLRQSRFGFYVV
jgi:hypothetical protein